MLKMVKIEAGPARLIVLTELSLDATLEGQQSVPAGSMWGGADGGG